MTNRNIMTSDEKIMANDWMSAHLTGAQVPFSFIFGGRHSADFIHTWQRRETTRQLTNRRMEHVIRFTDPDSGLVIRCVAITYHDFPVVEWTVYFKNAGASDTPIVENIRALDLKIVREDITKDSNPQCSKEKALLHYNIGSPTSSDDYRPMTAELTPGSKECITTSGGRSCNKHMPFFNLEWSGCGLVMAIGWPGQWAADFTRNSADELQISAGQELTHFKLHPGEEVRSPLIALQFYHGDWIRAQNIWRRWIIAHNMPRPGGSLPTPQVAATAWLYFAPWGISNALAMKIFIDTYEARKIPIDACWIDAGWYICNHPTTDDDPEKEYATGMAPGDPSWPNTGTWRADPYRYPKGIREVTDHAHAKGMRTILWFEPMRVKLSSWLAEEHPEWLLAPPPNPGDQMYQENERLLNLGNPDALEWLSNYIGEYLGQEGVDVYREDFNMDPLYFWRANDPEDRQGITEIRYVTNNLAYWDELLRRNPNLLIDNCASGSKRQDLEFMRRGVTFWRSDYMPGFVQNESAMTRLNANQCITYGIASWIPYYGAGMPAIGKYYFRSLMCPSIVFDFDPRRDDLDLDLWRRLIAQFKQVAKYFYGDYYPLTGYSQKSDVWMAWQFNCPETGEGMIQVFRRENCVETKACYKLSGLEPKALYTITDLDTGEVRELTGQALMENGLTVEIKAKPAALVFVYARK